MLENYIQGFRMVNATLRGLAPVDLDRLLTDDVRASSLARVLQRQSQRERLNASPLALRNLALSAKAYALLPEDVRRAILNDEVAIQNLTAIILGEDPANITFEDIAGFVNDEAVMSVVFSSEPASRVIAASETAMNAIVNSGAALSVLWEEGGQPAIEAMKGVVPAQKAFVNGPYYAEAFKPAVIAGILSDGLIFKASGTFTVPEYVTSVHVVCVGRGGAGNGDRGGGGGALRYANKISVGFNQSIPVLVGDPSSFMGVVANSGTDGKNNTSSYPNTIATPGGQGSGGSGGGNGGGGGGGNSGNTRKGYNAGGGAGGYAGTGGSGDVRYNRNGGTGMGGAGGGGGSGDSAPGGGGGGVGIYGLGSNGDGGVSAANNGLTDAYGKSKGLGGGGGSDGTNGGDAAYSNSVNISGSGGTYGGGGGGGDSYSRPGDGGPGVVRIIWGASRAFPSTNVEKIV